MNASDQVRTFVRDHYVAPARRSGSRTVTVRAGDVHKALRWELRRVPQVCAALSTRKFLECARVELIEKKGPPSGQSTTVEFTYRLLDAEAEPAQFEQAGPRPEGVQDGAGLEDLYGIFEEGFRTLGGGEAFLKAERAAWGPDPWEKLELEAAGRKEASGE
ncbi:MAG: hypothetical protein WCE75_16550 [Terracidiphilus sp.]